MIKAVHIDALVRSVGDFDPLVNLLTALGLRKEGANGKENSRVARFYPARFQFSRIQRKKSGGDVDLTLTVEDLDSALRVVRGQGLKVLDEDPGTESKQGARQFLVELNGGTRLLILGGRVDRNVGDLDHSALEGSLKAEGKHFGVVVSRFNSFITERLLAGTLDGLVRCGAKLDKDIEIVRVPGAFEIPSAARTLAMTGKHDAIVCLGCLLRGGTAHYDVIVNEVTRGIGQSAQETGIPHAFGVLTCDTLEQAIDRAGLKMGNKGFEAALAAVEMASLKEVVRRQSAVIRNKPLPRSARNDKNARKLKRR